MKSLLTIGVFISSALISTTVFANQSEINTIELASMQLNEQTLSQAIESNQGYTQALANYRLALSQNIHGKQQAAITTLHNAIQNLEKVVNENSNDDESWALLSQCYGLKIAFQPMLGATYGPKAGEALQKAQTLNPNNPRAALFKGIMLFNTPEMYGGSKTLALKAFDQAISLFADDKNSGKHWGEAEAYVWRGLSYQAINKNPQAKADFEMALQLSPDFSWAKMLLKNHS